MRLPCLNWLQYDYFDYRRVKIAKQQDKGKNVAIKKIGKKTGVVLLFLCTTIAQAASIKPQRIGDVFVYTIMDKSYEQVRDDLAAAIESQGMVISAVSHVKDMLDRTNTDLGYKDSVYDTGGETLLFCKSDLSQKLMRDNPHNIAFCPYSISIYTLKNRPNKVFLSYKKAPPLEVYKPITQLLDTIIQTTAE